MSDVNKENIRDVQLKFPEPPSGPGPLDINKDTLTDTAISIDKHHDSSDEILSRSGSEDYIKSEDENESSGNKESKVGEVDDVDISDDKTTVPDKPAAIDASEVSKPVPEDVSTDDISNKLENTRLEDKLEVESNTTDTPEEPKVEVEAVKLDSSDSEDRQEADVNEPESEKNKDGIDTSSIEPKNILNPTDTETTTESDALVADKLASGIGKVEVEDSEKPGNDSLKRDESGDSRTGLENDGVLGEADSTASENSQKHVQLSAPESGGSRDEEPFEIAASKDSQEVQPEVSVAESVEFKVDEEPEPKVEEPSVETPASEDSKEVQPEASIPASPPKSSAETANDVKEGTSKDLESVTQSSADAGNADTSDEDPNAELKEAEPSKAEEIPSKDIDDIESTQDTASNTTYKTAPENTSSTSSTSNDNSTVSLSTKEEPKSEPAKKRPEPEVVLAESVNDSDKVYLYTSFASASPHLMSDTNRVMHMLKAQGIEFELVDLGTNDKARRLWKWRSKERSLPAIVRDDEIMGVSTGYELFVCLFSGFWFANFLGIRRDSGG